MTTQMLQRRGTSSEWASINPILEDGEIGVDLTNKLFKIGDGVHTWSALKITYLLKSIVTTKGDLIVGTGLGTAARLPRGTTGQTLSIDADGNFIWIDQINDADYEHAVHAAATYETIVDAEAFYDSVISSVDMAAVYETIAASNTIHGLFETFTHSAATYETRAASDAAFEPLWKTVVKTTTQSVINSATMTQDTDLILPVAASSVYVFELLISYLATVAGKMSFTIGGPTGGTTSWGCHGPVAAITSGADSGDTHHEGISGSPQATALPMGGANATSPLFATVHGVLRSSTTAGNISLKFAQTTATADTGAQVMPGSYLRLRKI